MDERLIIWFEDIRKADIPLVGGKSASLGEMIANTKVPVPGGFAITAYAYRQFIAHNNLEALIRQELKTLNLHNVEKLQQVGSNIRNAIENAEFSPELINAVTQAYRQLASRIGTENPDTAVRSSATAEDLPDASFAGQQDTFLNISGIDKILVAVKKCFASLFNDRAINYRNDKGFDHLEVAISVAIQQMARSDLASSGVCFSIDTETGFPNVVYITGGYGLGDYIVQGIINPDQWYIFKPTGKIIHKKLGNKDKKLVYNPFGGTAPATVSHQDRKRFVLTDEQAEQLARYVMDIERHYRRPMDVEWALDGITNQIYIVQARPETVQTAKDTTALSTYILDKRSKVILQGEPVGRKIGQGLANILHSASEINRFKAGQVLITEMTDPDWEPIMKMASAIVTNKGGRTCHAAIISRELGITCVIGTEHATEVLTEGQPITVDCSEGYGRIYDGLLPFHKEEVNLGEVTKPKVQIMMNVGLPERAFDQAQLPHDGVGLARLEFIINSHIQIHPLALVHFDELTKTLENEEAIEELANKHNLTRKQAYLKLQQTLLKIEELTVGYANKPEYFREKLAYGIAMIAASFFPKACIVRLSDLKTREYYNLIGGWLYEPEEYNPMIGWRGCSRYYSPVFLPAFRLECQAIKKVREEMGLYNTVVMYPFCRTLDEADKTTKILAEEGLVRHQFMGQIDKQKGLQLYCMAEIPSNVILADQFADRFDGFSIGSNDLTQLTLGLDRDSELLISIFDERNEAVKRMIIMLIIAAHNHNPPVKVGICGQAPSDYPEFARFLVKAGIDSISLNPDTIIKTRIDIAKYEQTLNGHTKA